jgi:excisionase family DNA binding protein
LPERKPFLTLFDKLLERAYLQRSTWIRLHREVLMNNSLPLAVGIAEAVRLCGIGRSSIYEAIKRGELPTRKAGRRTLVLSEDLKNWLANLPGRTTSAAGRADL